MVILSCQGVLKLTAESEETMLNRCTKRLSSAKEKNSQVLMSILTNTLFVLQVSALACWDFCPICGPQNYRTVTVFDVFKRCALARGRWCFVSAEESLQSKELGNRCLISKRSITATCFTQSKFQGNTFPWRLCLPFNCAICCEKSQGYVNKMRCLCGGKFTSPSINIKPNTRHWNFVSCFVLRAGIFINESIFLLVQNEFIV